MITVLVKKQQKRLIRFLLINFIVIGCGLKKPDEQQKPPNLLFILTDEQRYDTSAPYGNEQIQTPHLNKLGESSVVFQKAYVTQPVCSPARSSILTGLYPHTTGVTNNNIPLDEGIKTLPELVTDTNYRTSYIGKWHLGRENDAWHGFDHRVSTEGAYTSDDIDNKADYDLWLQQNGYEPDMPNKIFSREFTSALPYGFTKSKFIENEGLKFLEENKDYPFILYLSFLEPHAPYNGPFNTVHKSSEIELDSSYRQTEMRRHIPLRHHLLRQYGMPDYSIEELFARYWGMVHQVDLTVGKVLNKLTELGLDENTIVVFTSEHGTMLGKFWINGKTVMYDESSRVPLIIRAPGIEPISINQSVSQIDLVPTLLELLGQPLPDHLQGKSLLALMNGEDVEAHDIFMEWNPFVNWERELDDCPEWTGGDDCTSAAQTYIRSIVTPDGWKLNRSTTDRSQLFNLNKDPGETINLYERKEHKELIETLKMRINDWQITTNDPVNFKAKQNN